MPRGTALAAQYLCLFLDRLSLFQDECPKYGRLSEAAAAVLGSDSCVTEKATVQAVYLRLKKEPAHRAGQKSDTLRSVRM